MMLVISFSASANEKLRRFRCHLSNPLPWRLLCPGVPCVSFSDRWSKLLPKHFKRRRIFPTGIICTAYSFGIWYSFNSHGLNAYWIYFVVSSLAFDSDWVGRIDPRSNREAPFCPWGGFPEALQSLLCYRQVLDKFLFSQPTSDSFIGYEGNNASPASHQSNPPSSADFVGIPGASAPSISNCWEFVVPTTRWICRAAVGFSVGSLDFVLQLRAEEGMDTVLQSLVLSLGTERTLRDLKDLKRSSIRCVYRKEYVRIYLAGASLPQSLVSCLIQGYATMTCCAFWCMAIPGEAQP